MIEQVTETREYQRLLEELRRDARVISISGLVAGAARALAVAALQRDTGKTFAVVSHTTRDLESWERDLRFWYSALSAKEADDKDILVLPASETDPYAGISPRSLIGELLPDVLVKGGDYDLDQIHGREEVEAAGGKVISLPFVEGSSTTALIQKINRR